MSVCIIVPSLTIPDLCSPFLLRCLAFAHHLPRLSFRPNMTCAADWAFNNIYVPVCITFDIAPAFAHHFPCPRFRLDMTSATDCVLKNPMCMCLSVSPDLRSPYHIYPFAHHLPHVSRCGLAVRRLAGKQKDLGSICFNSPLSSLQKLWFMDTVL